MPNTSTNLTSQDLLTTLQANAGTLAVTQAQVVALVREREELEARVQQLTVELAAAKAGSNGATEPEQVPTPIRG